MRKRFKIKQKFEIFIFLIGNEYYDIKKFEKLNVYPQIIHSFIQYLPQKFIPFSWLLFVRSTMQLKGALFSKPFYSMVSKSILKNLELRRFKAPKSVSFLPLGYTNRFVKEIRQSRNVSEEDSLLEKLFPSFAQKSLNVCFMGQKGSWYRRKLVESFQFFLNAIIQCYDGWGAEKFSSERVF